VCLSVFSPWSSCDCTATSSRQALVITPGVGCTPGVGTITETQNCTKPSTCPPDGPVTGPVQGPVQGPVANPVTNPVQAPVPNPLLSFDVTGTIPDTNLFDTQVQQIIQNAIGVTVQVSVTPTGSGTYKVSISGDTWSSTAVVNQVNSTQFADNLSTQTGTSIVPNSVQTPNNQITTPPPSGSTIPYWVWIIVGVVGIVIIGVIIAVVVTKLKGGAEIV